MRDLQAFGHTFDSPDKQGVDSVQSEESQTSDRDDQQNVAQVDLKSEMPQIDQDSDREFFGKNVKKLTGEKLTRGGESRTQEDIAEARK